VVDSNRDDIYPVLGRIPSGVFILTVRGPDGHETGMLASWVQQASFDPPAVTVAIKRGRYVHDWLVAAGPVALSLVGDGQKKLLGHFGKGFEPGVNAFEGVATAAARNGVTVLAEALGWLEGRPVGSLAAGDHTLFLVELTHAGRGPGLEGERPMVHIRKSGANY
jgi:flavin reductase (DIM6/NTAB) family NADH-FMN oxidoreductase RutF